MDIIELAEQNQQNAWKLLDAGFAQILASD